MWTDDDIELAYLAGLMDADGCFSLFHYPGRNRGRFAIEIFIAIKQVQCEAIDKLARRFGGKVHIQPPSATRGKPLYGLKLSGAKAVAVCHALLPFLCLKRRQAEILIAVHEEITRERYKELGPSQDAFYTTGKRRVRRYMISDTSMARRRAWLEEIRLLNDTRYPVHQVSKVTA